MNKKLVLPFLLLFFIAACTSSESSVAGFLIKGKITNYPDKSIALYELTTRGLRFIDSANIATDGSFELKGKLKEKTFCSISVPNGAVILVVDTNSNINLSVDANSPDQYGVNGSAESEKMRALLGINYKYMMGVRNLEAKYSTYGNEIPPVSVQNTIRLEYDSIMTKRKDELQNFAMATENTIVPFFVTNFLLPESDFDFLQKVDDRFYSRYALSKYAMDLHQRVSELRKTAVGQSAPDIVLPDPFGKSTALSSLRGKTVLIDFWASWCKPCRQESPRLVKLYSKYKALGFEIYSVSLDDNREAWQKAINDDKLLWTHVSDLRKWNSAVVSQYKIEAIPYTVLINRDGKIIAKNLRAEALEEKLREVFNQ
jgi:peroxiredoxin